MGDKSGVHAGSEVWEKGDGEGEEADLKVDKEEEEEEQEDEAGDERDDEGKELVKAVGDEFRR